MLVFDITKSKSVIGKADIDIERPVNVVFAFVVQDFFLNYPKWALEVVEFKPINDNPMAVGSLARQTRIDQGQRVESTFEVSAIESNRLLELQGLSEPYRYRYLFENLCEVKTRLTLSFELLQLELFMRPFEKLIRTAIEEGAENSLENIKTLLSNEYEEVQ